MKAYSLAKEGRYVEMKTYLEKLDVEQQREELEWVVEKCSEDTIRSMKWALQDYKNVIEELQDEKKVG